MRPEPRAVRSYSQPVAEGTLRPHTPTFVLLTFGVALVLVFLTFLPALSLGPLAAGLH